ncbi:MULTISPECIES: aminotransferase class I/II-fold pyridoxal phosphate-dependent enzyme [unclassified Streptomyces]|uniref:aminotransferase class I/II-fold pyridoxal phosphate-dependent enzyme n=1 Tax=unclassified Streptomyces TaxID=2593676 RepID=UPI002E16D23D
MRPDTKLFILSHPHNPTGNVWTEDELRTMGEICARHGVLVVSDEIHQDLVLNPARTHIPFASLGPEFARASITCTAPTHGEPWLEELLGYLRGNNEHFAKAVHSATSKLRVLPADALYLAWMDCRGLGMDAEALDRFMLIEARLWLDRGQKFGAEGHGYMRVNLGCPRSTVDEAIRRLADALAGLG